MLFMYECMYRMTNSRIEVRIFFIQDNNTPDAHFTQLQFETPQADLINAQMSLCPKFNRQSRVKLPQLFFSVFNFY